MLCTTCKHEFLLSEADICYKCRARLPGMSALELIEINVCILTILHSELNLMVLQNKPQCGGCGIISSLLTDSLCNSCINNLSMYSWFVHKLTGTQSIGRKSIVAPSKHLKVTWCSKCSFQYPKSRPWPSLSWRWQSFVYYSRVGISLSTEGIWYPFHTTEAYYFNEQRAEESSCHRNGAFSKKGRGCS